ncbi:MAG: DUF3078 domain-containing protein [Rikenellaceae bacterium]
MRQHAVYHYLLATLVALFVVPNHLMAQMSIDELPRTSNRAIAIPEELKFELPQNDDFNLEFASHVRERYNRYLLRQERNSLSLSATITGTMTSLSESWQESTGGNNALTGLVSLDMTHTYSREKLSLKTVASAKLGYTRIVYEEELDDGTIEKDPVLYKNNDSFSVSVTPSYNLSDKWSYGLTLKLQSQFTEGYVSSTSQEYYNLKSDFMSPGYLDLSANLTYKCANAKWPVTVTVSPLAANAVYVLNDSIIENAQYSYKEHLTSNKSTYAEAYGVGPNSHSKYTGGSSVTIGLTKTFGKNKNITYTGSATSYYAWISLVGYKNTYTNIEEYNTAIEEWTDLDEKTYDKPMLINDPTVVWSNKLVLKASKILTTTVNYNIKYDKQANETVQTQLLLNLGFSLSYKNK